MQRLSRFSFIAALFIFFAGYSNAVEVSEIHFSGGAELDDYQPRIIVPILTEAFKRNGIKFYAKYYPSERSLYMSNKGITDGELHRVYEFHEVSNKKYPNLIRIDSQLLSIWLSAFSVKEVPIENWEDLKHFTVAYYRGRQNVKSYLESFLLPEQIIDVDTDYIAFQMLARNRVDIVISENHEGNNIIKSSPIFNNIQEIKKLEETQIYSFINKKYYYLALVIAKTIEDMKKDGTFNIIFEKAAQ